MLTAKIVNHINFPKISLQKDLEHIAKNIIISDLIMRIRTRQAITGGAQTPNSPETLARKAKKGHGDTPLIDTGKLVSSFYSVTKGKDKVVIKIDTDREDAAMGLQYGLKTRRYNFFGISKDASDGAMKYMDNRLEEITSGGKG